MNEKAARAYRAFLEAYGLDLQALGMKKTPARVAELYEVLLAGVGQGTKPIWGEVFESDYHGLLTVTGLRFYSLSERRILFTIRVTVWWRVFPKWKNWCRCCRVVRSCRSA